MRRRNIYVGQANMMELLMGGVIVVIIIIIFHYLITSYYMNKIQEYHLENTYNYASLVYKILQSDQLFSITSRERGYLDLAKIHTFIQGNKEEVCERLHELTGGNLAIRIKNIEKEENILCENQPTYDSCNVWEICEIKDRGKKYDLFISLYDIINNKVYIGKLEIWIY